MASIHEASRARAARVGFTALPHGRGPVRPGRAVRRHRPRRGRAPALPGARVHRQLPRAARQRPARRLRRLPGAALERARPDEGRHPLRRRGDARRVRRARGLDDVEVRAAAAALRRRQGRRALQPARDVAARARAADAPLHLGAAADHRPEGRHPGAGHGDERADDGLDDGHLLDAEGPRRAGDRHRQADLDRRLGVPARGDRRRRRDDDRARLRAARLEAQRAALRRAGLRQRRRDRGARARSSAARRCWPSRTCPAASTTRPGSTSRRWPPTPASTARSRAGPTGVRVSNEELLELECDILVLAARENQVTATTPAACSASSSPRAPTGRSRSRPTRS